MLAREEEELATKKRSRAYEARSRAREEEELVAKERSQAHDARSPAQEKELAAKEKSWARKTLSLAPRYTLELQIGSSKV